MGMKFHHGSNHERWGYCLHLGPYTTKEGLHYDLGICEHLHDVKRPPSFAIVYGEEPWEYHSGSIEGWERKLFDSDLDEAWDETLRRYKLYLTGGKTHD